MKKIRKISLHQGHLLSTEDMAVINGGVFLSDYCDGSNVGQPCLYGTTGNHHTGRCVHQEMKSEGGATTTIIHQYFCQKDPE